MGKGIISDIDSPRAEEPQTLEALRASPGPYRVNLPWHFLSCSASYKATAVWSISLAKYFF